MVKKLLKHEYLAWLRILPIIYGITLVVAAMLRVIVLFENDSDYYGIVFGSAVFMFVVAMIATIATPVIFGIRRFYVNMFSGEGYLTHTLPVTASNHLWVKAIVAATFSIVSLLVCLLAGMIATFGEVLSEIFKAGAYLLKQIPQDYMAHVAGWAAEFIVLLLVATFGSYFLYYLCICIGQLFRKNRVLAAVGVYFGIYMVTQILSTVLMVEYAAFVQTETWTRFWTWVENNAETAIHLFLGGAIVVTALLTLVYYWICHHTVRKKLNLE